MNKTCYDYTNSAFVLRLFQLTIVMRVFNLQLPDKPLTNVELSTYARELHSTGIFMRDILSTHLNRVVLYC